MFSFCLPLYTRSIKYTYQGLKKIGELKRGETLVVSGAAGSVGTVACQLGKAAGAKVYAIAGSDDKCLWLEQELGVDKAFNYKSRNFHTDMKKIGYLDVYFDNVGGESHKAFSSIQRWFSSHEPLIGEILDFLLTRLNKDARIILCGESQSCSPLQLVPRPLHGQGLFLLTVE
jgi:hypothetical protein